MRFILTVSFIILSSTSWVYAGEIYSCGTPAEYNLPTDTIGVCDIYSRQLEYRGAANSLRDQIQERQANFAAPAIEARKRYEASIKKLNEERGTPKDDESE